jgi:NAD(P)-dependent dehydrogenase (short-subunit alcohol dehydrogenase family)
MDPLAGRVVVLAGPGGGLMVSVGADLLAHGVLLAVVTVDDTIGEDMRRSADLHGVAAPLVFLADPTDMSAWARIAAHVEQRLGPVDGVVADPWSVETVRAVFAEDMGRRGHGAVILLTPEQNPVSLLRQELLGMR